MIQGSDIYVVKVGTSTLTSSSQTGVEKLNPRAFNTIGDQIRQINNQLDRAVVVSSAAITAGMEQAKLATRPSSQTELPSLQALAAIGWHKVVEEWDRAIKGHGVGSLLVTANTFKNPDEIDALMSTITQLHQMQCVPIVNENDAITTAEIVVGDNDTLAARLAVAISKSAFEGQVKLVLLTDVDGVYEDPSDPKSLIKTVSNVEDYVSCAQDTTSQNGTGGMATKFEAARIATEAGVPLWIANGSLNNAISAAIEGQTGTYFPPKV